MLDLIPSYYIINLAAIIDLINLVLTLVIIGTLLLGKKKTGNTLLLAGGFASVAGILATYLILNVTVLTEWVPLQFQCMLIGLGCLLQFAYRFPQLSPERTGAARFALAFALFVFLAGGGTALAWYLSLIDQLTLRLFYLVMALVEYLYVIIIFIKTTILLSRQHSQPGSGTGSWQSLKHPSGRDARAMRAFALIVTSPVLIILWAISYYAGIIPNTLYVLILDWYYLALLFSFAITYMNNAPETTTFMIKLVLSTLVTMLAVINVQARITLSDYERDFEGRRLPEVRQAEVALFPKGNPGELGPGDLPASIAFVVSHSLQDDRKEFYSQHFVRDNHFSLRYINENGLYLLPTSQLGRVGYNKESVYKIYKFRREGREFIIGFPLSMYRDAIHPHTIPILYVILGSVALVVVVLPVFLRFSLVKPLERLLEGVHMVNAGQKNVMLPVQHNDEIGYLTRAFNRMVVSVTQAEDLKIIQQEMELARIIQTSLLPKEAPVIEGLDIAGTSIPARKVGGDLYFYHDMRPSPQHPSRGCAVAVGDVTGKGLPAALYMAVTTAVLSAKAPFVHDVAHIMEELNSTLFPYMSANQMFTALCYMRIDRTADSAAAPAYLARVANAGLIPPILRRGEKCEYLELGGLPLGILTDVPAYRTTEFSLQSGDMLVLSSDGIVEAENDAGKIYNFDRLISRTALAPMAADEAIQWILADVHAHIGNAEQHDDMTLVVVVVT